MNQTKPKLQINLLSCGHRSNRFPFTLKSVQQLQKIKNKDLIVLCIHGERNIIQLWRDYFAASAAGLRVQFYEYPNAEYLDRVRTAQKTECEYSCKLDDDVLISCNVWDYIIDNLHMLSDKNPIIAPILTNGMPSVEMFVEDFLDEKDKETAYSIFRKTYIPSMWGLDYSAINRKIASMSAWSGKEYWDFMRVVDTKWEVTPLSWVYFNVRGVHPARFSMQYNMFVAEKISQNKDKFFNTKDFRLESYSAPYFTNNIFISKTQFWRDTLPLYDDGFDEGQMSLRMLMDNSAILYVRNGFGIHMAYGMTEGFSIIENTYMRLL